MKQIDSSLLGVWRQTIQWKEEMLKSYEADEEKNEYMIEFTKASIKSLKAQYEELKKKHKPKT
jgi:hypothetical protein